MSRRPFHIGAQADLQSTSTRVPVSPCPNAKGRLYRARRRRNGLFYLLYNPNIYQVSIHVRATLMTSTSTTAIPKATIYPRFRRFTILNSNTITSSVRIMACDPRAANLVIAGWLLNDVIFIAAYNTAIRSRMSR